MSGGAARTVPLSLERRPSRARDTVVHAGRFWDGTGDEVREDVDVVVRDGRITAVEPHRAARVGAARRVDASGRTVLPGLWDAHTHPWQTTYGGRQTALQLAYGITTAVSCGGFSYEQARIREAVAAGALAGPRLLTCGELLDGGRVAYSMGRAHRTRAGLRRSLERGAALDWDFVKTYVRAPGWVMEEAARFAHQRLGVRSGSHLLTPGVQLGQDLTTHLQATQRVEFGHAVSSSGHAYQDVEEVYTATGFHLLATPFSADRAARRRSGTGRRCPGGPADAALGHRASYGRTPAIAPPRHNWPTSGPKSASTGGCWTAAGWSRWARTSHWCRWGWACTWACGRCTAAA